MTCPYCAKRYANQGKWYWKHVNALHRDEPEEVARRASRARLAALLKPGLAAALHAAYQPYQMGWKP